MAPVVPSCQKTSSLPTPISNGHIYFLSQQVLGDISFVLGYVLEDTVLPPRSQPSLGPNRERTPNKSTPIHEHARQSSVPQHHRCLQTGHYTWSLCVGCEGGMIQLRPRSWKGASQPRTLERASQAVEKKRRTRGGGGSMVCRETGGGWCSCSFVRKRRIKPGHTIQDVDGDCFVDSYRQYGAAEGWLEEGCHNYVFRCIATRSDCS